MVKLHPIAFHSQPFLPELNYETSTDKELLAIFEAFQTMVTLLWRLWTLIDVVPSPASVVVRSIGFGLLFECLGIQWVSTGAVVKAFLSASKLNGTHR